MSQTTEIQESSPEGYKLVQLGPKTLQIPIDWQIKRIDEITENLDRKREPIKASERENGDVPYYGATGQVDSVSGHLFDEKLVLVGEDGADWSPFGGTSYIISGKSWVNNHVHVLRCTNVVEEFLSNYLDYIEMRHVITGTNRGKLNQSELNQFPVLSPPLPEQRRIAGILSKVDELIQQTEEIIAETKQLKRGYLQDLYFSPEHGTTTPQEPEKSPKSWDAKALDELCDIGGGSTPRKSNPEYWDGNTPWCSPKDFDERGIISDTEDHVTQKGIDNASLTIYPAESTVIPVRSNVIKRRLPVGKITMPATINQDLKALVPDEEVIDPEYLFQILHYNSERLRLTCRKSGTTIDSIDTTGLKKYQIMVPDLSEQREIAEVLSNMDQKVGQEEQYKQRLQDLKHGLMQDLLTGEIRVKAD